MNLIWKRLICLLSIFCMTLSIPGCGYSESYVEQERAASYSSGYDDGYSDGYDDGYDEAHNDQNSSQSDTSNVTSGSQIASNQKVWIPQNGSKYHSNKNCSNMKNPDYVTISEAERRGYEPCENCY